MERKAANRGSGAAQPESRVGPNCDGPEVGGESVVDEQPAREAIPDAQDFLHDLKRLERPHDPRNRAQDACFTAIGSCSRWGYFWKNTAITRRRFFIPQT